MISFSESMDLYRQFEKPPSTFFHKHVSKNLAKIFTFISLNLGLTPNVISLLSLILVLLSSVLVLTHMTFFTSLLILVLLQISYGFDCTDGVVARATKKSSKFGAYLDILLDRISGFIFLTCIVFHIQKAYSLEVFYLSIVAVFIFYSYQLSASFRPFYFPKLSGYMKENKNSNASFALVKFLYEFIDTGIFFFIISIGLIFGCLGYVMAFYLAISLALLSGNIYKLYSYDES